MVRNRIHVPPWSRRITFANWSVIFVAPYFNLVVFRLHDLHPFTSKSKEIPCLLKSVPLLCPLLALGWPCPLPLSWGLAHLAQVGTISSPNAGPAWWQVARAPSAARLNWSMRRAKP